jgi:diaminohydroxyphosphoribosylaminopyrimidine deaminase / 5-amino-6-(5-phosphoribosylamino)uracil reductase
MKKALTLARKGWGKTSPNPCVGCVIVQKDKLIGQGWHKQAGQAHAEIEAIRDARRKGHRIVGSTIYITLEPCCTHGRTPPCTSALIQEKPQTVVIATVDPNPAHAGRALPLLQKAGIQVITGILEAESQALNRPFNHWIKTGQPWVIAKAALSIDGKLTRPRNQGPWLSGEKSRQDVQLLRSRCDAILVGAETARLDNPHLTVRLGKKKTRQPWRIIMTRSGRLSPKLHLFQDAHAARTLVYQNNSWSAVLKDLGQRGVTSLLVEGGAEIFQDLVHKKYIHEVILYLTPLNFSGHKEESKLVDASILLQLELQETVLTSMASDLKIQGLVVHRPKKKKQKA